MDAANTRGPTVDERTTTPTHGTSINKMIDGGPFTSSMITANTRGLSVDEKTCVQMRDESTHEFGTNQCNEVHEITDTYPNDTSHANYDVIADDTLGQVIGTGTGLQARETDNPFKLSKQPSVRRSPVVSMIQVLENM